MTFYFNRVTSLYNMSLQVLVDLKDFDESCLNFLPEFVKEDMLTMALKRGKATDLISIFLHPKIRELHINGANISTSDLENMSKCKEIRILEMNPKILNRFYHTPTVLKQLFSSVTRLVRLHIQRNNGVTDNVLMILATCCPGLQELDVSGCNHLSDAPSSHLSQLNYLRALNISQTMMGDETLAALSSGRCSQSLAELTLNSCLNVSDSGLKSIINCCNKLAILICSGCPKISGCATVRSLDSEGLLSELLCCKIVPANFIQCRHFGNCILKLHSGLLLIL